MVKQVNNKEYKQTQIGNIPEDWTLKPLEQLCIKDGLVRGPFGGSLKKEFFIEKGIKVYEQKNAIYKNTETGSYFIDNQKYVEMKRFEVFPKDFIVSCSGTIGKIFQIPENAPRGIINQALLKIRTDKSQIFDQYFFHYFNWDVFQARIIESTQGGAMKNLVGMDIFRKTMIALPPNEKEQCSIARVLSDVDYLIEALGSLIEKKKCIKQGAMQELLTGKKRLFGDWKQSDCYNHTEIGIISEDWEFRMLDKCADIIDPHPSHRAPPLNTYGIPFVGIGDLSINGDFVGNKFRLVDEQIYDEHSQRYDLSEGLIGIGRVASIGKVVRLKDNIGKFVISPTLAVIKPKNIDKNFLFYILNSEYVTDQFDIIKNGSTRNSIGIMTLRKILVPVPKQKKEQVKIAKVLSDMDSEIETLELKRKKYRLLKVGLMQQLLTGRIRLKCPS